MKITKSQLRQIIKEELAIMIAKPMEGGCGDHGDPGTASQDVEQMSGDEAFGFAWTQATQHLRDAGMEEAATLLDGLSGPEEVGI